LDDPEVSAGLTNEQRNSLTNVFVEADKEIQRLQKAGVLVSAIAGGLAASAGNASDVVAGTLAPALAYQIGQYFKENSARNIVDNGGRGEEGGVTHLLAHAILGAAVASSGENNALVGAVAAAGAEAAAPAIAKMLYGKEGNDLSAEQKASVSSIVGAGGALLGSLNEGMTSAIAASQSAKNSVDNNWGEVGHYSTMATILYLAGFSEKDAKALALAAWSPDTDVRNAMGKTYQMGRIPVVINSATICWMENRTRIAYFWLRKI